MNEFLALVALTLLAAAGTGVVIAGVAHYAWVTDRVHRHRTHHGSRRRPARGTGAG